MSTDASADKGLPKTVVPSGIADPVERARAELKAALAAIEHKSNFPARAAEASERKIAQAKVFARRRPAVAVAVALAVATSIGAAVWGAARIIGSR